MQSQQSFEEKSAWASMHDLSRLIVSPAVEKTLSLGRGGLYTKV